MDSRLRTIIDWMKRHGEQETDGLRFDGHDEPWLPFCVDTFDDDCIMIEYCHLDAEGCYNRHGVDPRYTFRLDGESVCSIWLGDNLDNPRQLLSPDEQEQAYQFCQTIYDRHLKLRESELATKE